MMPGTKFRTIKLNCIKETIEKEHNVCKLHTYRYITNY